MRGKRDNADYVAGSGGITPAGAGKTRIGNAVFGVPEDHPRRCGENSDITSQRSYKSGSPPQVRGKHEPIEQMPAELRITPAGAGKTHIHIVAIVPTKDHPRRCGENEFKNAPLSRASGSPPQVRGKRIDLIDDSGEKRITPAGAGKTGADRNGKRNPADHPRRCGENRRQELYIARGDGSPPQVRGKLHPRHKQRRFAGITPAGAGKTCFVVSFA